MKKITFKLLAIFAVMIFLLNSSCAIASSNINQLNNEKKQNQNKIEDAKDKKEEITEQKNKTVAEVEKLNSQISDYENQIEELEAKIGSLNNKIKEEQNKLDKAQEDYEKQEKIMEERLVIIQEAGETTYLDFLLSSESFTDFISNYYLVAELAEADTELLEKIQKQKEDIKKAKEELEVNKNELNTSKASKQSISTQLKATKSEKNKQVEKLSEEEKALQAQIDELNSENKSLDAKIKAAQDAIKKAQEVANKGNSGGSSSGGTTGASSSAGFIYPVPAAYARITTGPYYSSGQYHGASDFGSAGINGQPIYAVADGYVVTSENLGNRSYGNYILIAHYNGLYTLYAHGQNGSRTVKTGDTVKQGQQIMKVGNTGNSTGPHLHFEVRVSPGTYSCRKNPANYLP